MHRTKFLRRWSPTRGHELHGGSSHATHAVAGVGGPGPAMHPGCILLCDRHVVGGMVAPVQQAAVWTPSRHHLRKTRPDYDTLHQIQARRR